MRRGRRSRMCQQDASCASWNRFTPQPSEFRAVSPVVFPTVGRRAPTRSCRTHPAIHGSGLSREESPAVLRAGSGDVACRAGTTRCTTTLSSEVNLSHVRASHSASLVTLPGEQKNRSPPRGTPLGADCVLFLPIGLKFASRIGTRAGRVARVRL